MSSEINQDNRTWGMLAHLSALIGYIIPLGNIIAPLVIWQIQKEKLPFAAENAKESLNFNISWTIYCLVAAVLVLVLIGIILLPVLWLAHLILAIIAGVKANNGESYRYPLTLRLVN